MFKWIEYVYRYILFLFSKITRSKIDTKYIGINSFYNDNRFGYMSQQSSEIYHDLGIEYVRILFRWDDNVQLDEHLDIFWGFLDDIIKSTPKGMKVLVVVAGIPDWLKKYPGDKQEQFYNMFTQLCSRYKYFDSVIGYQVWNEPNMDVDIDNHIMEFIDSPQNYIRLLKNCYEISKKINPDKLILNASTTSIIQNYPDTIKYNKELVKHNVEDYVDIFAIHFYGKNLDVLYKPENIDKFLKRIKKPIWVTESGTEDKDYQLTYVEKYFSFLLKKYNIEKIFYYIYYESSNSNIQFGIKYIENNEIKVTNLFNKLITQNKEKKDE